VPLARGRVDLPGQPPRDNHDRSARGDRREAHRVGTEQLQRDDDDERDHADGDQHTLDRPFRPAQLAVREGGDGEAVRLVVRIRIEV
jgi:hypothetical protein